MRSFTVNLYMLGSALLHCCLYEYINEWIEYMKVNFNLCCEHKVHHYIDIDPCMATGLLFVKTWREQMSGSRERECRKFFQCFASFLAFLILSSHSLTHSLLRSLSLIPHSLPTLLFPLFVVQSVLGIKSYYFSVNKPVSGRNYTRLSVRSVS